MPRYRRSAEPSLAEIYPPPEPDWREPADVAASEEQRERAYRRSLAKTREADPYAPGGPWSYFDDLLTLERARRRQDGTFDQPRYGRGDPGPEPGEERPGY